MPPKRRRPPGPEPESPRQPSPAPDHDHSAADDEEEDDDNGIPEHSRPPFYNTTFSAHRVSPLYLGSEPLTTNRLQILAQRLRDRVVGDVVRGVEVGPYADSEESIIGKAGALEKVEMHWVAVADVLDIAPEDIQSVRESGDSEEGEEADQQEGSAAYWRRVAAQLPGQKALHISLRFEMASSTALMLPPLRPDDKDTRGGTDVTAKTQFSVAGGRSTDDMDWEHTVNPARFLSLPLLLLRMPVPLKTVVGDFLATTFDCRVSPMRLGTRSLVRSWEAWIRSAGLPPRGPLARDAVLSLGFYLAPPPTDDATPNQPSEKDTATADQEEELQPPGLRSIEVIIPAAELQRFVFAGKRVVKSQRKQAGSAAGWGWETDVKQRRLLAGRLGEEGWEWRLPAGPGQAASSSQPFTEALASYLKGHLGLNLFHPGVRVTKIACGGFAMSENRLKMFAPADMGATQGSGLSLLGQRGAVLELLGGLVEKARSQAALVG